MNIDQQKKLRELLDRYYAADTTADEEKKILEMLSDSGLPDEFLPDREMIEAMFAFVPDESFETRLSDTIDALASKGRKGKLKSIILRYPKIVKCSMAASLAALIAVMVITRINAPLTERTYMSPKDTYEQTTMALMFFADALNKGYNAIEIADSTTVDATEKAIDALATIGTYFADY